MKPFLKWAGGKSRMVPRIEALLADGGRFLEPFCGSAALLMGMSRRSYGSYLLADKNDDLIVLYNVVRSGGRRFVDGCRRQMFVPGNNTREAYNRLRAEFNMPKSKADPERRSMLFVYLNRFCYNGLCRYNNSGGFNVPFGSQASPYFPETELLAFAEKSPVADFVRADFREIMALAGDGDVAYCDPPYAPLSPTASFESYAIGGFGERDHADLADHCFAAAARGAHVVLSNHDTPLTRRLYAGARVEEIAVTRSISGNRATRGKADEILVVFEPGLARRVPGARAA